MVVLGTTAVVGLGAGAASAATRDCSWSKTGSVRVQAECYAMNQLNKPYARGAAGPNSFDCSGLVQYSYNKTKLNGMPRTTYAQWDLYRTDPWYRVKKSQLSVGDLVFFDNLAHVGIYAGGGKVVHAPYPGAVVRTEPISTVGTFYGALHLKG